MGSGSVRGLVHYAIAGLLVRIAAEGAGIVLVLLAIDRLGSPAVGGFLIAALLVPQVVAAPAVGLVVDRAARPRWILAGAAVVFGAALAVVAAGLGRWPLPVLLAVLLVGGCCGPAVTGGLTSQLGRVVPEESLSRAFGIDSLIYNVSGIVGPALAAVLAGTAGSTAAALAFTGCAVVGAGIVLTVPLRGAATARTVDSDQPRLRDGLLLLVRDRTLAVVTGASSFGQLGTGALPVIAAVLATRLHDPNSAGWLMTAVAVGALGGSLGWTLRPAQLQRGPMVVMVALIGIGVPLAVSAATTSSLTITLVLFALSGVSNGPFAGALFATRQDRAPEQLRAQTFTIGAGMKTTAAAAGAALAGLLSPTATALQLGLAAACPLAAGLVGALLLTALTRRQPRTGCAPHSRLR